MTFSPEEPDDLLAADADPARALPPGPEESAMEAPVEAPVEAPRLEVETRSEVCNCCSSQ